VIVLATSVIDQRVTSRATTSHAQRHPTSLAALLLTPPTHSPHTIDCSYSHIIVKPAKRAATLVEPPAPPPQQRSKSRKANSIPGSRSLLATHDLIRNRIYERRYPQGTGSRIPLSDRGQITHRSLDTCVYCGGVQGEVGKMSSPKRRIEMDVGSTGRYTCEREDRLLTAVLRLCIGHEVCSKPLACCRNVANVFRRMYVHRIF
jgi:hypothetical protein